MISRHPNSQVGILSSLESQSNTVSQPPFSENFIETTVTQWSLLPTVSNFASASSAEILAGYYDLGDSLGEMNELGADDDWKIDNAIFNKACLFAGKLLEYAYPPPKIFNHGPKSIVFSWSENGRDAYLTIAENSASTLISEGGEIIRRTKYPIDQIANPAFASQVIPPMQLASPVRLLSSVSTNGSEGSSI